ncbi:hypothetical protein JOL79_22395 [Microbispora sp. RL4-1S]|uniref:Phospholipase n=1 Tax=Microbispora oryzae TaxID=2806554 RepID=A0A940WJA5_9ACTN|nr:hypothetical protein [Microbispora oryzae]MBP2706561.1 hypothetical protein [Microbispora oryzae]
MRRSVILAVVCLLVSGEGCTAASPEAPGGVVSRPPTAAAAASGAGEVMAVMRDIARCVRSHGAPGFPDPIMDPRSNYPAFPDDAPRIPDGARTACAPVARRLPPEATVTHPPSPGHMAGLRAFARCMRDHGVGDFPDPDAAGAFPMPRRILALGKGGLEPLVRPCRELFPEGGLDVAPPEGGS